MSITKCLNRKDSRALIKYLLDGDAHDKGVTKYRNLVVTGHNLETTPGIFNHRIVEHAYLWPYVAEQFKAYQTQSYAASKGRKKNVEAFHLIFSFSDQEFPLQGDQKKEAKQAAQLVGGYLTEHLPNDSQWVMAIQRDGKGHKLHAYVALNSVKLDGKVIRREFVTWRDLDYQRGGKHVHDKGLASSFDEYLTKNFEKTTGRTFTPIAPNHTNRVHYTEEQIIRRGGYDWHQDLKDRIIKAANSKDVHDLSSFEKACAQLGVTVVQKRRGTGQKDAQGHKIYKLGYTYSFIGKDKYKTGKYKGEFRLHKMRDYRVGKSGQYLPKGCLGEAFTPESILKEIERHELIKKKSITRCKQEGISENEQSAKLESSSQDQTLAIDKSGGRTEDETDGPTIESTSTTVNEATTSGSEPGSATQSSYSGSYSSSSSKQAFAPIRHLKYVDWSVFDPDAESDRRTKRKQQEREKRFAAFQRRAEAIAEHNRELARNIDTIERKYHGRNKFRSASGNSGLLYSIQTLLTKLEHSLASMPTEEDWIRSTRNLKELSQLVEKQIKLLHPEL